MALPMLQLLPLYTHQHLHEEAELISARWLEMKLYQLILPLLRKNKKTHSKDISGLGEGGKASNIKRKKKQPHLNEGSQGSLV